MTISKLKLSGSTYGKAINVTGTATGSANTIHTAHATALDEVWLYAHNTHTADVVLTLEWGETTAANTIIVTVPSKSGLMIVVPGLILTNSLLIKAFAGTTAVVNVTGFVNRIA